MACCLLSNKSISFPMQAYCRLDLWKQISVKFEKNKTIFLQYNEFEYVICKMAAFLSQPHCVFVFVFVFDELYLYLYLYLIRFFPVYLYLYLYLKLRKKMYLYLIKRIWPQPWTHWDITTLQMNSSVFKPHEWAPFQSNYNFTLTHDQYKVECLYNAVTFVKILHSQRCQNAIFKMLNDFLCLL